MNRQEAATTLADASRSLRANLQPKLAERVEKVLDWITKGGDHEAQLDDTKQ